MLYVYENVTESTQFIVCDTVSVNGLIELLSFNLFSAIQLVNIVVWDGMTKVTAKKSL